MRYVDAQALGIIPVPGGQDLDPVAQAAYDDRVQAALDTHVPLAFTPHVSVAESRYPIGAPKKCDDDVAAKVCLAARVQKEYDSEGSGSAMFRNRDLTRPLTRGRIVTERDPSGARPDGAWSSKTIETTGSFFALYGRVHFETLNVDRYGPACLVVYAAGRVTGRGARIIGGPDVIGSACIRYAGGQSGFRWDDFYGHSGDDLLQAVPAGSPDDPWYGFDVVDAKYSNASGYSKFGKFATAGAHASYDFDPGDPVMTNSIEVTWATCSGRGGINAIRSLNRNSTGHVAATAVDCDVDCTDSKASSAEVMARREATVRATRHGGRPFRADRFPTRDGWRIDPETGDRLEIGSSTLTVVRGDVTNPLRATYGTVGDATLHLTHASGTKPRTASEPVVQVPAGRVIIDMGAFDGGGVGHWPVIDIGPEAHDCELRPRQVTGIGHAAPGISVAAGAAGTEVAGRVRYEAAPDTTDTTGVRVAPGAVGTVIGDGADYTRVTTPISAAGAELTITKVPQED